MIAFFKIDDTFIIFMLYYAYNDQEEKHTGKLSFFLKTSLIEVNFGFWLYCLSSWILIRIPKSDPDPGSNLMWIHTGSDPDLQNC